MRPVETKVKVGTAAATVAGALIWILQTFVFKSHPIDPTLQSYIYILTPAVLTFVGGYLAKHTHVSPPVQVSTTPSTRVQVPQGHWVADAPRGSGTQVQPEVGLPEGFVPPSAALGGTVTRVDPAQVPTDLKEPATEAGQPPSA